METEKSYLASLIETRVLLEIESAKLAAERRTNQDIEDIRTAMEVHAYNIKLNQPALEEDLAFHLAIAKASKNAVVKSLMLIIRPGMINGFPPLYFVGDQHATTILAEHEILLKHIIAQNTEGAATAMRAHLKAVYDFGQRLKNQQKNGTNGTH